MWTILLYIITAINLLLYLYIIVVTASKWKVSKAHRRFWLASLFAFLWIIDTLLQGIYISLPIYKLITFINFALAPIISWMFVSFIIHFPKENIKLNFKREIIYFSPLILMCILSFSNLFIKITGFREVQNVPFYFVYFAILILYYLIIMGIIFYKKIKSSSGILSQQLIYLMIGYLIAALITLGESVYINYIGAVSIRTDLLSTNATIFFSVVAAYVMLRYRFMDVRVIIRKGATYSISLLLTLAVYTYIALALKDSIEKSWNISTTWTAIILIGLVALGFPPLKNLVEKAINTLFKGQKSIDLAVKEVRDKIAAKTDLQSLVDLICAEVKKYLSVEETELYVIDHKDQHYVSDDDGEVKTIELKNDLVRYFEKYSDVLVRDEIPHLLEDSGGKFEREILQKVEKEMKKHKASLAMPFRTEDEVFGILLIGERSENRAYTVQDVQFLEKVREQTGFTVANALLYKEAMARIAPEQVINN